MDEKLLEDVYTAYLTVNYIAWENVAMESRSEKLYLKVATDRFS